MSNESDDEGEFESMLRTMIASTNGAVSIPKWQRAVLPPTAPDLYNVRIISRASDGTLIVMDMADVPRAAWAKNFGVSLSQITSETLPPTPPKGPTAP